MTLSFLLMPALGCFLLGLGRTRRFSGFYTWLLFVLGLSLFTSAFWHMMEVDLWFVLSYSLGPFLIGFSLPWQLSNKRRRQIMGLGVFFLIFFVVLYFLILGLLNTALA